MAFKKRRMMFVLDVNPESFVFFFEKGNSGASWSIRDYSIRNRMKEYGPRDFRWARNADDIHQKAQHSLDAPTHPTDDLAFWHNHTLECNKLYLGATGASTLQATEAASLTSVASTTQPIVPRSNQVFPVLNLHGLSNLPKSRKSQDMERILHSPNSEDWVTWNFFQILLKQYPSAWWAHVVKAARMRNSDLNFPLDDGSLPTPRFWTLVRSPSEYEAQRRARMLASGNVEWTARARMPEPVEGASEIDIICEHHNFVVFIEAKLGSDVSMSTTYDPQRNQIIRNIDCLIANAGRRTPIFWLLARDEGPTRSYTQLINSYRSDPSLLVRELPHRDAETLTSIAQNLTILLWSDFKELVCGNGADPETTAVKRELERRILGYEAGAKVRPTLNGTPQDIADAMRHPAAARYMDLKTSVISADGQPVSHLMVAENVIEREHIMEGGSNHGMTHRERIIATSLRIAEIRNQLSRLSGLQDELRDLETSLDKLIRDDALTALLADSPGVAGIPGYDEAKGGLYASAPSVPEQVSTLSDINGSIPSIEDNGKTDSSVPNTSDLTWIHVATKTLSPREEKIIKMYLGLQDGKGHTFEEIGQHFAVTKERIQQIYSKARRKLRRHVRETLDCLPRVATADEAGAPDHQRGSG
jgi:RNA polymerase sigma factor (sigma-70 family)